MKKIEKNFHIIAVLLLLIPGVFIVVPFAQILKEKPQDILIVIAGIIFWMALISAICFFRMTDKQIRKYIEHHPALDKDYSDRNLLLIFSNKKSRIADIAFAVSAPIFILLKLIGIAEALQMFALVIMVCSLNMHCLFNGKIYHFIERIKRRREKNEKCKAHKIDK